MIEELVQQIEARFGELSEQMADPAVIGDRERYAEVGRAYRSLEPAAELADLGSRWEILDTGVTVKLYPSCAGTHPTLDALLDLRAETGLTGDDVEWIHVGVDAITPTVLVYADPASDLEAKFSLPFCAAAAVVFGRVGIDTFEDAARADPRVRALLPRVSMVADDTLDRTAPPLTQANVHVRCRDGREFVRRANGARGYPSRPASDADLRAKFTGCAARVLPPDRVASACDALSGLDAVTDVREWAKNSRLLFHRGT